MDRGWTFEHDRAVALICLAEATRAAAARRRGLVGSPEPRPRANVYSQQLAKTIDAARAQREQARIQRERAQALRRRH